jgi:aspartate kinase
MIVMKFGGTSVKNAVAIERAAKIVRPRLPERPVVIVSALAGVTDQLVALGEAASLGKHAVVAEILVDLRARHYETARKLLKDVSLTEPILAFASMFEELESHINQVLATAELSPESSPEKSPELSADSSPNLSPNLSPKMSDCLLAFGELLSSELITAAFAARGIPAVLMDARQCVITDNRHTRATLLFGPTAEHSRAHLVPLLDRGSVPVLGGFIAATQDGVTTTLGRGGSDYSAAIIGAVLDAQRIEIWTDVNGIMTTDPKICSQARRIQSLSFYEASELAFFGAKVLHPATLLPAMEKKIPVHVLNSCSPKNPGTCIQSAAPPSRRPLKAIAAKNAITVLEVSPERRLPPQEFLRSIFEVLERNHCAADLVTSSDASISLAVHSREPLTTVIDELRKRARVHSENGKAIVCLVGEDMHSTPGLVTQVFAALGDINVRMVSQGASRTSLSFVVPEADAAKVVSRLHAAFFSARLPTESSQPRRRTCPATPARSKPKLQPEKSRPRPVTEPFGEDLISIPVNVG